MKISMFPKQLKTSVLALTAVVALACAANAQNEFGPDAGNTTLTGDQNTADGYAALTNDTSGYDNVAYGYQALTANTTGQYNTATGDGALEVNTTGSRNTAFGLNTLTANTNGEGNTAIGMLTLQSNTDGYQNTAIGDSALAYNTDGSANTAIGLSALVANPTGNNNIALGYGAGSNLTTGDNNIYIGNEGVADEANTIHIGTTGTHTNTFIAGISGVTVPNTANPVVVDSVSGQLGTVDISTLVGPAGPTGATGPTGPTGATGVTGATGPTGPSGTALVTGAYLFLPSGSSAPSGYTKIGSTTTAYKNLTGHAKLLSLDIYQKN